VVNDFSLRIQQNEIICLLGNNGSGKTTLINMLVGLVKPDSGYARIYGHDLETELFEVRNNIRLCQQFDFLYQDLTPREHLELVCEMRSVPEDQVAKVVDEILETVMLTQDQDTLVGCLSGGMKRKLSLGKALIGDAKFIILDEPTSSLDYQSRVQVWKIIRSIGKGRTILLTTQHIEEADHLSDKICIIKDGSVLYFQTPDQLKKEHRYGYRIDVQPEHPQFNQMFENYVEELISLVLKKAENSYLVVPRALHKLSFMIPYSQQVAIGDILSELIQNYPNFYPDVTMNTLEDAYIHIYNNSIEQYLNEAKDQTEQQSFINDEITEIQRRSTYQRGKLEIKPVTFWSYVKIMIRLRYRLFLRSPRMWVFFLALFVPRFSLEYINKFYPEYLRN